MIDDKVFSRVLDTTGDGTGTLDMATNHVAAASYKLTPGATSAFLVHRLLLSITDTGAFDANKFGNGLTPTNGIAVRVSDGAGVRSWLTDSNLPITTNGRIGTYCYDVDVKTWGIGPEELLSRWTFEKAGRPLVIDGGDGEFFEVVCGPDDFSDLDSMYGVAQGYVIPTSQTPDI